MYTKNRFIITIVLLILLVDNTEQSHAKQATITAKAITKTIRTPLLRRISHAIKKPIMQTFVKNMKDSVNMVRQNKNTIKNFAYGLQEKYLKFSHNFASKSVKRLGGSAVQKFKSMTPSAIKSGNQLVGATGKQSIMMRSADYMRGKKLSSLQNMASKSSPQLPLLAGSGLVRLTQFGLVSIEAPIDMGTDFAYDVTGVRMDGKDTEYKERAEVLREEIKNILPENLEITDHTPNRKLIDINLRHKGEYYVNLAHDSRKMIDEILANPAKFTGEEAG